MKTTHVILAIIIIAALFFFMKKEKQEEPSKSTDLDKDTYDALDGFRMGHNKLRRRKRGVRRRMAQMPSSI